MYHITVYVFFTVYFLLKASKLVQETVLVIVERFCGIHISDGTPTILAEVSCHFPQSFPVNAMANISGYDFFLSHSFRYFFSNCYTVQHPRPLLKKP